MYSFVLITRDETLVPIPTHVPWTKSPAHNYLVLRANSDPDVYIFPSLFIFSPLDMVAAEIYESHILLST